MIQIRPVSDLRNKFPEIETIVNSGNPVFLTKNGYGSMVVLSLEEYANLTDSIETKLDEADRLAAMSEERFSHETVFKNARSAIHGK
ncbi:MAG: type II toxin-antitoxin system Phd/YefM family antitoxin [Ruminococcus sp.]|nr:type II toxin-antitoxin system Phd/YefM family antitoxin [Ruminococcus sp.]